MVTAPRIAYDDVGVGDPAVILLHGLFANRTYYAEQSQHLAAAGHIYITHWSVRFPVYTPVDVNRQRTFGELLREYRYRAGLSQELLAERAGLSLRGIQDLERGVRRSPYPATARRVADALELDESDRQYLMQAARPCARSRAPVNSAPPFRLHVPSDANTNLNKCAVVYQS